MISKNKIQFLIYNAIKLNKSRKSVLNPYGPLR